MTTTEFGARIFRPSDFSTRTTDVNRDTWLPGEVRHLAAALGGRICMVETVKGLLQPYAVVGYRDSFGGHGHMVLRSPHGDNTAFFAPTVGDVVYPMGSWSDRPDPVRTYRDEAHRAILRAQRMPEAVEAINQQGDPVRWEATPWTYDGEVRVSAYAQSREPARRDRLVWHGTVKVLDIDL
jgi:hypothetical protein